MQMVEGLSVDGERFFHGFNECIFLGMEVLSNIKKKKFVLGSGPN